MSLQKLQRKQKELILKAKWGKALEVTEKILHLTPRAEHFTHKGYILIELQRYEEALKSFQKALQISPEMKKAKNGINKLNALNYLPSQDQQRQVNLGTQINKFGRYNIIKELGRGGMGRVFHAYDPKLERDVALKIIIASKEEEKEAIERFIREAKATAKLKHPNIVRLYDVGIEQGHHFFTMDYIKGHSLKDLIEKQSLSYKKIMKIFLQICYGMEEAHHHRIIHRDLKPANVMINEEQQAFIMDFGLAKFIEGDKNLSKSGGILGTPAYMPPEQARGELKKISDTSDIYSLGGVLYFMLVKRAPFKGNTIWAIITNVVSKDPLKPRYLNRQVPTDIETICLKCLEKEQPRRYQSVKKLSLDVQRYLNNESILAKPASFIQKSIKWVQRNRLTSSLFLGFTVCLITLLIIIDSHYKGKQKARKKQNISIAIDEALTYKKQKKYGISLQHLEIILHKNPKNKRVQNEYFLLKKIIDNKIKIARDIKQKSSNNILKLLGIQKVYEEVLFDWKVENQQYFDELNNIRIVISQSRNKARIYYEDGKGLSSNLRLQRSDLDNCVLLFSKALAIDNSFSDAYFERGQIYRRLFQTSKARQDYQTCLALDKDNAKVQYYLNVLEFRNKKISTPANLSDINHYHLLNQAQVETHRNTLEARRKAIDLYNQAEKIRPSFADTYYQRAALRSYYFQEHNLNEQSISYTSEVLNFKDLRDLDSALQDLNKYQQLQPLAPMGYFLQGYIYTRLGLFVDAEKQFLKFYELVNQHEHPPTGKISGMISYAVSIMVQGRYNQALSIFSDNVVKKIKKKNDQLSLVCPWFAWKGIAHMLLEEYDKALFFLNKSIELDAQWEHTPIAHIAKAFILIYLDKNSDELDTLLQELAIKINNLKGDSVIFNLFARNTDFVTLVEQFPDFFILPPKSKSNISQLKVLYEQAIKRSSQSIFLGPTEASIVRMLPRWAKDKPSVRKKFNNLLARKTNKSIDISLVFLTGATFIEIQSLDLLLSVSKANSYDFYYRKALAHYLKNQNKLAIVNLEKAIKQKPSFMPAHYALATILAKEKQGNLALLELFIATELGWQNVHYTMQDPNFKFLHESKKFQYIIKEGRQKSQDLQILYRKFAKLFPSNKVEFPMLKTIIKHKIDQQ